MTQREGPAHESDDGAAGYSGFDNGETDDDTGYPDAGDRHLIAGESTPGAPVIDLGVTLANDGGEVTDDGPEISRRDFLGAAIGHPLDDHQVDVPGSSPATADDDEAQLDTDEDLDKVETSDPGYETPTGAREPSG